MPRFVTSLAAAFLALGIIALVTPPESRAHQSGCHAAHSCPSDTGSYVCGDTGNYNFCPALSGTGYIANAYSTTVGSTVSASFSWTAHATASYQWTRAGQPIQGATTSPDIAITPA